jgi:hypothetical protein
MQDIGPLIQNSIGLYPKANILYTEVLTNGAPPFFLPPAMILWNALTANTK